MIKIKPLLQESFTTYKSNFRKIFIMTLPIAIIYYVTALIQIPIVEIGISGGSNSLFFILFLVHLALILTASLFLAPALNRAVQSHEDGHGFDVKRAFHFQKTHFGKYIMVNVWGFLYLVLKMLPYIVITLLLLVLGSVYKSSGTITLISTTLAGLALLIGFIMNVAQFIFFKTIFFSKEISPKGAVQESIEYGVSEGEKIWKIIFSLLLISLSVMLVYLILGYIGHYFIPTYVNLIDLIISPIVSSIFIMPLFTILIAKGYVKLRK